MATETAPSTAVDELDAIPATPAPTPERRKNVVKISLSEEGMALAKFLGREPEEMVGAIVEKALKDATASVRSTVQLPF